MRRMNQGGCQLTGQWPARSVGSVRSSGQIWAAQDLEQLRRGVAEGGLEIGVVDHPVDAGRHAGLAETAFAQELLECTLDEIQLFGGRASFERGA